MAEPNRSALHCFATPYIPSHASQGPATALAGPISLGEAAQIDELRPYIPATTKPPKKRNKRNPQPWDTSSTIIHVKKQKPTKKRDENDPGASYSTKPVPGWSTPKQRAPIFTTPRSPLSPRVLNFAATSTPKALQPILTSQHMVSVNLSPGQIHTESTALDAAQTLLDLLKSTPAPPSHPVTSAVATNSDSSGSPEPDGGVTMDIDDIFDDSPNISGSTQDTSIEQGDVSMEPADDILGSDKAMSHGVQTDDVPKALCDASVQVPVMPKITCDVSVETERDNPDSIQFSIPRTYRKIDQTKTMHDALEILRNANLTPMDLILNLCNPEERSFERVRNNFFREANHGRLMEFVHLVHGNKNTEDIFLEWIRPIAVKIVGDMVNDEMEKAKPAMRMYTTDITPQYMAEWSLSKYMDPAMQDCPTWTTILERATYSKETCEDDASNRERPIARQIITSQVMYTRSRNSAVVAMGLGMCASSMGASRQLMGMLNQAGMSVSYNSTSTATDVLADGSIESAREVAKGPHAACYDNFQTSTSIFVEQTAHTRAKVQSGTFFVIYKLPESAKAEHMRLADLIARERNARLLELHDLRPSRASVKAYRHQSKITVINILIAYGGPGFERYSKMAALAYTPRRKHKENYKTEFFPGRVTTIEEASVGGNDKVVDNIWRDQLKIDMASMEVPLAVPSINDQLTNARLRGVQELRKPDVNFVEQRSFIKLAPAWFHGSMNGQYVLRLTHYGSINEPGCLANLYPSLGKTRLGNAKPDYHTLETANTQILEGLILNAWEREAKARGFRNLTAYATSKPSSDGLLNLADIILTKYATPTANIASAAGRKRKSAPNGDADVEDPIHENTLRMTRDLLLQRELVLAMRSGDIGRIEDILIDLSLYFRGAGAMNYANELQFFAYNLYIVWTPEFADIMRDISLVNISGLDGHAMAIDLNIEHLIGYLKALFSAKGIYGNWERCGSISASINNIMALKRQVTTSLKLAYQGKTHSKADSKELVLRMADKAKDLKLQEVVSGREGVLRPDLRALGLKKMASSGLDNFNKRILSTRSGLPAEEEEEEIPAPEFAEPERTPDEDVLDFQ